MSTGLLGFESIEERRAGVDGYISASRLNCWLTCPAKLGLQIFEGIRTPTSPALFLGKACHSALEVFYRHRQLGITLDAEQVTSKLLDRLGQARRRGRSRVRRMSPKSRPCGSKSAIW